MSDHDQAALSYRLEAPMRWLAVAGFEPGDIEHAGEVNLRALSQIAQFEERTPPIEQPTPQDVEIQRLHAKLDLLLSAVSELAPHFLKRPARVGLQMFWDHLRWPRAESTADAGTLGWIEIYLHPIVQQPLRLPARMLDGDAAFAEAEFLPMADAAQQALERHVFQQHRRAIAAARRS
ncbi:Atypical PilZ domain-containing protein, cyclic di-GMP receptor [Hydrocarboniphaga daqingensis]|jgi:hypothetical protein|uniref:Atypical PilZ domain-containing protein, cyclic di-GMP receptor n=1 Tax=Hydrocarboniphaga daqingensis TaxID=490188 RepID=A0A1M5K8U8_9GAMM|nr:PilZ domain-containing protein [Hydrocarboniphaga daqingensis]SHG49207.1 Atypical PilZ domain-containing protein, cyclic di-GMP receptor [Hydrocarboniphaga daqingensis]